LLEETPLLFIIRPTLKSIGRSDYHMIVAKILFLIGVYCCCCINYNITRVFIDKVFFKDGSSSFCKDFLICFSLLLITNVLTYLIDDVMKIPSILARFYAVFVCYVCPVLCYVKSNEYNRFHWKNIFSFAVLVFMCVISMMSICRIIISIF
jgi:hypothetical protein